ncbi:MAG: type II secretion system protein N [Methylophilus sp.]|jgi:general secretion pathway protein N
MKRLFLLGIISTLFFLCVFAPAQLLGSLLSRYTEGRLGLASTQGSLWHGNAYLLLNAESNQSSSDTDSVNLGKLSWDIQALQLLIGRLSVSLAWNEGTPFWLTVDSSRLHVEHAVFNLPPETMAALVPALKAVQLGGQLTVRCDNFSLTQQEILGQINIAWDQASSPLSLINPLGSYQVHLDGQGNKLDIKLNTQNDSPLIMQGSGLWTSANGLHFEGTAEASASAQAQLQELLRVMGNETMAGSGRYELRF